VITNSAGATLVNSSFDAFGRRRGSNWSGAPSSGDWAAIASTTRRGYTDHSMLDNLNLIHMNGRVQDPLLGRFVSADPYITEPGNTQNYNRYSYVYNNPLTYLDPSGFTPECFTFNFTPGRPQPSSSATAPNGINYNFGLDEVVVTGTPWTPTFTYTYCPTMPPPVLPPLLPPNQDPNPNPNPNPGDKKDEPQGECWRPFTAGDSFASEYLSRLGNLGAGILDSVSGSIDLGLQIKGKVNVGPLLNADATYGVINFSAGTSAAGNVDLNVRLPEQGSWVFGEVSAGGGNAKYGAARNSVVDGISVRRGPYEDYAEGFFFTPKYKTHDPQWGKFGAHLQLGLGAKLEVDVRKIGIAVSCAFD
jgi:RHS repeat-associated protein